MSQFITLTAPGETRSVRRPQQDVPRLLHTGVNTLLPIQSTFLLFYSFSIHSAESTVSNPLAAVHELKCGVLS